MPENVRVGGGASVASPQTAANDAPPRIIAMEFSSLDLARPSQWSGVIITSTNVASVELKTNQFSISVPRETFGRFVFRLNVLDVPAEFVRTYALRVIARNAAGVESEEDVPLRLR